MTDVLIWFVLVLVSSSWADRETLLATRSVGSRARKPTDVLRPADVSAAAAGSYGRDGLSDWKQQHQHTNGKGTSASTIELAKSIRFAVSETNALNPLDVFFTGEGGDVDDDFTNDTGSNYSARMVHLGAFEDYLSMGWIQRPQTHFEVALVASFQVIFVVLAFVFVVAILYFLVHCYDQRNSSALCEGDAVSESVTDKVAQFQAKREEKKTRQFWRVIFLGLSLLMMGDGLLIVGNACVILPSKRDRFFSDEVARIVPLLPLGYVMRMSGLMMISTIPTTTFDFDDIPEQWPIFTLFLIVVQCCRFMGNSYHMTARQPLIGLDKLEKDSHVVDMTSDNVHPYIHNMVPNHINYFFLPVLVCYILLFAHTMVNCLFGQKAYTTISSLVLLFLNLGYAAHWLMQSQQLRLGCKAMSVDCTAQYNRSAIGLFICGVSIAASVAWQAKDWYRQRMLHLEGKGGGRNPTLNFYYTIYFSHFFLGIAKTFNSVLVYLCATAADWNQADKLDSIDQHPMWRLQRAEIGVAMAFIPMCFLIIGRERVFSAAEAFFENKQAAQDGAFMAELLDGSSEFQVGQTWWLHHGGAQSSSWSKMRQQFQGRDYATFDARKNWHAGVITRVCEDHFEVEVRHNMDITKVVGTQQIRRPNEGMAANELLEFAKKNLRCIDWENLTFELMSGQTTAGRVEGDYSLSRPVREGEEIDFFLSHSWHDDATIKYAKIKEVVEEFYAEKKRYPTFWLDKVCIEQSRISDGLKVLPVNVMACSQMLVMWGTTYSTRLWCAWELCTLFSFMQEDQARARLKLVALGDAGEMLAVIRSFDVNKAHCYDPNEEGRIRTIVAAVGEGRFNESIRNIAN